MNLGGYDQNSFNESNGNAYLTKLLQLNGLLKTHFSEADKVPNFDGFFEICEKSQNKVIPIGRINVQIKTIDKDYRNNNKEDKTEYPYKYSCESKVFNAVKQGISLDPTILFLIDIQSNKAYWIHVSEQYVFNMNLKDEGHKTVYFSDVNLIRDIDIFYSLVAKIYKNKRALLLDENANKFLLNGEVGNELYTLMQEQWDYLNNLMDNELRFIKEQLFNNVWKFGIAYTKGESRSALGLYMIKRGENNVFIKDFDFKDKTNYYTSSFSNDYYTLNDIIRNFIDDLIKDYFKKAYIKPEILPDIVLEEISYEFLDAISRCCKEYEKEGYPCVYYKDEETVQVLDKLWEALEEISFQFWFRFITQGGEKMDKYPFDPIDYLQSNFSGNNINEYFYELTQLSNPRKYRYPFNLILSGKFGYGLFKNVLEELSKRNINVVRRVWKHEDFLHSRNNRIIEREALTIETGYQTEDYYSNLEKLLMIVPYNYSYVARNLFSSFYDRFRVRGEYNIWYCPDKSSFSYESAISDSDQFNILINPSPYIALRNIAWDEISKLIPNLKQTRTGFMGNVFYNKIPLYQYISLLLYKGVCESLGFKFKSENDISFIL